MTKYIAVEFMGKIICSSDSIEVVREAASKHKGRTELSNGAWIFSFVEQVKYKGKKKNGTS
jgi:hypothetical protein